MLLNANPPIFSETEKFHGTNFATLETLIIVAASSQGVLGCLQGTIPNPASPQNSTDLHYTPVVLTIPLPNNPTPWYSTTPSGTEWAMCNAWAWSLLLYNTKNAIGLGLKLNSTAAEVWTSLISQYKVSSLNLTMVTTQCNLHNTVFADGNDFPTHMSNLCTKWVTVNNQHPQASAPQPQTMTQQQWTMTRHHKWQWSPNRWFCNRYKKVNIAN